MDNQLQEQVRVLRKALKIAEEQLAKLEDGLEKSRRPQRESKARSPTGHRHTPGHRILLMKRIFVPFAAVMLAVVGAVCRRH